MRPIESVVERLKGTVGKALERTWLPNRIGPPGAKLTGFYSVRLQSARGLAALCVAIGHCFLTFGNGRIEAPGFRPSIGNSVSFLGELFFQQETAVVFFYVLSGLVLGESWRRSPALTAFSIRRLWRIVPVMWLSIVFALAVLALAPSPPFPGATTWFNAFFDHSISPWQVLDDFLGLSWNANSVLWSVQIELCMILLLPVLTCIADRLSIMQNAFFALALLIVSRVFWGILPGYLNIVLYAYCFYVGLIIPQLLRDVNIARILSAPSLVVVAFALLVLSRFLYVSGRLWMPYKLMIDTISFLAIIAFILCSPQKVKWLCWRPLVWLGDVSYSFYAFSMSLQLFIAGRVLHHLNFPPDDATATLLTLAIAFTTVLAGLIIGAVSYKFVEVPSIAIGRRISQNWLQNHQQPATRIGRMVDIPESSAH